MRDEFAAKDSWLLLQGPLLLRQAEELRAQLLQAMQSQPQLRIDCGGVTEADLSTVQTLLSAGRSARRGAKPVVLRGDPAPALCAALERAGFPPARDAAGFTHWMQGEAAS
jgi:ABC-type transporter Mla MlaB component